METVKRSVIARDYREGEINRQSTSYFQGNETTLHDTIIVDTCHYTCVQNHRMYTTKSES